MKCKRIQIWLLFCAVFLISGMASTAFAQGNTVTIDEYNRVILNGQPFFPLGLYVAQCPTGDQSSQLTEIQNSPFDTLMNYAVNTCSGADPDTTDIDNYLDQLEARDLKLIFSLAEYFDGGQNDIDTITDKVTTFQDHAAVISWYLNDERDPTYLTQLEARYQKIKELDQNHPVWSVHYRTDWLIQEAHTTDIVGVDPYPICNPYWSAPITLVSTQADEANAAGKPLWLVPQIFNWEDYEPTGCPPTKAEMRAMSYLAVNHGAKGLVYYSYFDIRNDGDYPARWIEIKDIASEIDQLRPVLLSTDTTNDNDIVCDNSDIDFKLMRNGRTYYLLAVNTKEEDITGVSFQINRTRKPSEFNTLFESGRQISVISGSVTDDFGVYEVHVYYWEEPEGDGGGGGGGGGCFISTTAFGSYVDPPF